MLSLVIASAEPLPTLAAGTVNETVLIVALFAPAIPTPTIRNSCLGPAASVRIQAEAGAEASATRPKKAVRRGQEGAGWSSGSSLLAIYGMLAV